MKHSSQSILPDLVPAVGHVVPVSMNAPPTKVLAIKSHVVAVGKPTIIPYETNGYAFYKPIAKQVNISLTSNPFRPPVVRKAIHHSIVAGIPEIVVAKPASFNDNDPENFSSFKSLQGLRQPLIRCMMQDRDGNLWFGTYSGGISKYDGKYFTNYTIAQGLSNDGVWSMIQDHKNNIWMATLGGGIIKFDGTYFAIYKTSEGLCDNNDYCLCEDNDGNIWIGTKKGLSCFNGSTFTNYCTDQGLPNDLIHAITKDKKGNIWVGTEKGVAVFSGNAFKIFTELNNQPVNAIFADVDYTIWFGTDDSLIQFDANTFETYSDEQGMKSKNIDGITRDKKGNLWIASLGGGIEMFNGRSFRHFTTREGLSNNKVTCVLEDRSGIMWFGSNGGGACRWDGNLFTHITTEQGLAYNEVKGIAEDRSGNLWFATWGGGVSKWNGRNFENFSTVQGLKSSIVFSILIDSKNNLWFGTDKGICMYNGNHFAYYDATQGFSNSQVWSMMEDKAHDLWFATFGDGIYKFDGTYFTHFSARQGLGNTIVMCLQEYAGNVWFGTYGAGVYKYDGKTFTNFNHSGGLSSDEVMDMAQDKAGNLWIGTIGGGVNKYDGKSFTHYSTAQGLSNEIVMGILEDSKDNLWFSTRNGLNRMMMKGKSNPPNNLYQPIFKKYLFEDGFLGVNAYVNSLYQDSKGNIWIGTGDRLTCLHPEGEIPDTIAPTIQLMNVSLYNEKISWQDLKKDTSLLLANGVEVNDFKFDSVSKWYNVPLHLSLAHNNNYLVFNYVGIATKSSYNIKYQYKLVGIDEEWNAITDRTEASYGNIPYGNYVFKVKAMNSEGYWSREYAYSFEIRPAWWQTWFFKTFAIIAVVLIFYSIYRYRLQQILHLQKIRNKIAGDLHDDIGSTLNSISVYSEVAKNYPEKRNDSLRMIGESSRKVIDAMSDIVWAINPENDTFENIILRMRSLAFNLLRAKNIEYSFQVNEGLSHIKLPMEMRRNFFLIFKETLTNLVKYSGATMVSIQLLFEGSKIKLIIRDNGKGFDPMQPVNGNGLNNMKRRASEMHTEIKIESAVGAGTQTELALKL